MTDADILAVYTRHETEARAEHHGMLLPEDVLSCISETARVLGLTVEQVKDVVRRDAAGMLG